MQAAVGPHRRAADLRRPAAAAEHPDQGPAHLGRGFREHHRPHQSRRLGAAPRAMSRGWNSARPNLDRETRLNGSAGDADRRLPVARRQRADRRWAAVKQDLADAAQSFPDDLEWKVTYDPTTFVTATIHEVREDAGRGLRARGAGRLPVPGQPARDADPDDRRPGQPDRHVRRAERHRLFRQHRLAARPRAGDRHRRRRRDRGGRGGRASDGAAARTVAGRGDQEAMGQITAPIIAITLVLLSVFVPIAFIPGISGELFRQFAVTVAVSMFLSAINALTLSPALCAILLQAASRSAPRADRLVMRGIDWVRDGYGAIVARLVRISIIGLVMVAVSVFGIVAVEQGHADRLPAGGRPGRVLRHRAVAGRRLDRAHQRRRSSRSRTILQGGAGDRRLFLDHRPELHRQLLAAERRLHDRHAEAVRGAHGPRRSAPPT